MENIPTSHGATSPRKSLRRLLCGAVLLAVGLGIALAWAPAGRADNPPRVRLAVLPFEINDTSGEIGSPNRHEVLLAHLTRFVGERISALGTFDVLDQARVDAAVAAVNPGTYLRGCNGCELDIAKRVGADRVMIGWLFKMSTLVLSLHVVVKDVPTGTIVYAKTFDFRGDNETAWKRAADYMVEFISKGRKQKLATLKHKTTGRNQFNVCFQDGRR